jgi:hypothetical protein
LNFVFLINLPHTNVERHDLFEDSSFEAHLCSVWEKISELLAELVWQKIAKHIYVLFVHDKFISYNIVD